MRALFKLAIAVVIAVAAQAAIDWRATADAWDEAKLILRIVIADQRGLDPFEPALLDAAEQAHRRSVARRYAASHDARMHVGVAASLVLPILHRTAARPWLCVGADCAGPADSSASLGIDVAE